jgi:RNA polymerase sigma factor (sigma-70 family)
MTEDMLGLGDPVIRRLQQAFLHEEPATELAAIIQRAARYQELREADDQPPPHRGLTKADLVAARRREPAAVTRVYTAYAPTLFRFFMAEVGNRQEAQDLTGSVFVSAIEGLPGFRGPVEALGGWLFRIARHDLYDFRRHQARAPGLTPLDDALDAAVVAGELPGQQAGTQTVLRAVQAALVREASIPRAMLRWLQDMGERSSDPPLNRLSPREREILGLLARGWSNRRIAEECFLSVDTVRTHVQNVLVKLGVHSKLEAVSVAMRHGWPADAEDVEEVAFESLEDGLVMAALEQLVPDQREVLLLRMVGGLTAPEVAGALGKTTGAVKALQHRGLASLARVLGLRSPHDPPDPPHPSLGPDHLRRSEEQEA